MGFVCIMLFENHETPKCCAFMWSALNHQPLNTVFAAFTQRCSQPFFYLLCAQNFWWWHSPQHEGSVHAVAWSNPPAQNPAAGNHNKLKQQQQHIGCHPSWLCNCYLKKIVTMHYMQVLVSHCNHQTSPLHIVSI